MNTFKVINGTGFGKSIDAKVNESAEFYGVNVAIVHSENAAFGNREFAIIETNESLNSDFIQSIAYSAKVEAI